MDNVNSTTRYIRNFCFGGLFAIATIVFCCIALDEWFHYYTLSYKPIDVIEANERDALRSRFHRVLVPEGLVNFEWFTYDNKDITQGPYKPFVVLDPVSKSLKRVELVRITLKSSLGKRYEFDSTQTWPVVLESLGKGNPTSHTFEPSFAFGFDEKEVIHTEILLRTTTDKGTTEELIKIDWAPIRVRHFSPLV